MVVKFEQEYLQELFEQGKCNERMNRFPPRIIKKYCVRVETLQSAPHIEALYPMKSLNFEALVGDKKGVFSIRIDLKYRLEFTLENEGDLTICNLQKISNHYD